MMQKTLKLAVNSRKLKKHILNKSWGMKKIINKVSNPTGHLKSNLRCVIALVECLTFNRRNKIALLGGLTTIDKILYIGHHAVDCKKTGTKIKKQC